MTVLKSLSLSIIFCCVVFLSHAQPGPGDPSQDPDAVPITGLEYLLIGGGVYGISRLLKKGKPKEPGM
jgi:hypothetical protein